MLWIIFEFGEKFNNGLINQMKNGKALFLDRDGTLIYDKHYLSDPDEVEVIPAVGEALAQVLELGYQLFLFSNQSGVGRGYFSIEAVHACNQRMVELMGFTTTPFTETCLAIEPPEAPAVYRKPSPRFIVEMLEKYSLCAGECYMVGDKMCDWQAGINAGINAAGVLTGKPITADCHSYLNQHTIKVYKNISEFVQLQFCCGLF